ncbi:hypothetical protein ACQ4LE_001312 [Meloidogyne hapla]
MANTFFVVLPSNVSDYPDNRPNKYRVHLPKPIEFQGGNWVCGLYSIQYPQSWAATIGTDAKQWIDIHYRNQKPRRVGIPKTTQLTPGGLRYFLKLVLSDKAKSRKRREVLHERYEDEIIISPEISLEGSPVKKRQRRDTVRKPLWLEAFFDQNPHNYWEAIRDFEHEFEQHNAKVEEKSKEVRDAEDDTQKHVLQQELDHLHSLSEDKKKEIGLLRDEAKTRDDRNDQQIAREFLEKHQDDYHKQIIQMEINIIERYIELEEKIRESKDEEENARSSQEIQRFINSIKRMRKNLEALESAVIERDLKTTREEFHKQNSRNHSEYVQSFFNDHPEDHWVTLKKNLRDLKSLHVQIREKREAHLQESDEGKKNQLGSEIDQLNKLALYRRNRFKAIHLEAVKKWKSFGIPIPPTNEEIKDMQKIEERRHPEYLENVGNVDDQGSPVTAPPPEITEEMIDVVRERHDFEQEKERKEREQRDKKEQLKHARRIELESETEEKEEGGKSRRKPELDLEPTPEIIPTEEIYEEYEEQTDNIIEEKEAQGQDLHSVIEFDYLDSIDRFRAVFNDPEIREIVISPQLGYVLGFPAGPVVNGQIGKYGIDLKGGFTSFAVYSKGLTSSVIMGNSVSSLLRIVAVENKSGGVIERVYDHPMFIPVLPRELNEVEIELRWMNGSLVKFDHGTVIVTLMFNKLIKF